MNSKNNDKPSTFQTIKSTLLLSFLFISGFFLGLLSYYLISNRTNTDDTQFNINRSAIVERVSEQGFLVTRTAIIDQTVTIEADEGSAWSNFWWGHEINAEAQMQIDIGIDLAKITDDDIEIDRDKKLISISTPQSEIYNTSLYGEEISLSTKSGILKKLLDSDKEEDFNLALEQLEKATTEDVRSQTEIFEQAEQSAQNILQSIFNDTDYKVEIIAE
jgi:hypothetical protein